MPNISKYMTSNAKWLILFPCSLFIMTCYLLGMRQYMIIEVLSPNVSSLIQIIIIAMEFPIVY